MSNILCSCGKKPATIHVTELINGEKKEVHLCEDCAKKQKIFFTAVESVSDLKELFGGLLDAAGGSMADHLKDLRCPECGITFAEIHAGSRFGCPNDYEVFREGVDPLLERIHGTTEHRGKTAANPAVKRRSDRLGDLRAELRKAVTEEAYERAARIRDQIYALKKELGDEAE
jgi:protein arginine kinase activator